jgi:predicted DNA binding CopG/RHH family protein
MAKFLLSLKPDLLISVKEKAKELGLTPTAYIRMLLIKDVQK